MDKYTLMSLIVIISLLVVVYAIVVHKILKEDYHV